MSNPLFIASKVAAGKVSDAVLRSFQEIERWSTTISGFYASLTGPGETSTPGDLQQLGGFTAIDFGSTGFSFIQNGTGNIDILSAGSGNVSVGTSGTGFLTIGGSDGTDISNTGPNTFGMQINDDSTAGMQITEIGSGGIVVDGGTSGLMLVPASGKLGFNGATPIVKRTVTGSRGGNAALASLLTALANLGLLTDSSTP